MKKVMVFGTFDIIHKGHLHMFRQAKEYGDCLIVVVARDKTVEEVKKRKPKNNEDIRLKRIKKIDLIDYAYLGYIDDKYRIIKKVNPDIVALGYDQQVFVEKLTNAVPKCTRIVRLQPYMPEVYKSSKM